MSIGSIETVLGSQNAKTAFFSFIVLRSCFCFHSFSPCFSPKCRFEYKRSETPSRYYCYCGKVENPAVDPWLVPHSCGQICEREFKPSCGHKCLLLCHPGKSFVFLGCVTGI